MEDIYNRIKLLDKICYSVNHGVDQHTKKKVVEQVVKKYYDGLIGYKYCNNPEKIKIGDYIKYISLDMNKVGYGLVTNITKPYNDNVYYVMKSTFNNKYWKIDPYKYFLFYKKIESIQKKKTKKFIDEHLMNV